MVSVVYGIIIYIAVALSVWHMVTNRFGVLIQLISASSVICYLLSALLHGCFFVTISVMLQYMFFLPTLVNILPGTVRVGCIVLACMCRCCFTHQILLLDVCLVCAWCVGLARQCTRSATCMISRTSPQVFTYINHQLQADS